MVDVDEPALADHHPVKPEPVEGEGDTVLAARPPAARPPLHWVASGLNSERWQPSLWAYERIGKELNWASITKS